MRKGKNIIINCDEHLRLLMVSKENLRKLGYEEILRRVEIIEKYKLEYYYPN